MFVIQCNHKLFRGFLDMKQSAYSHPDAAVRHSYPLAIEQAGFATAFGLMLKTLPYAMTRYAILLVYSVVTIVWLIATFGVGAFLGNAVHPWMGLAWMAGGLGLTEKCGTEK